MELDFVRLKVLALLKERGSDLRKASLAMGRNTAYMHQYIYRGSPKVLGEDDRIALAEHLGVDEDDLRHQARPRPQVRPTRRARPVAPASDGGPLEGFSKIAEIDVRASARPGALLERFEKKLSEFPDNTRRAVIELAKEWRTDRVLRRLEAMLAVVDKTTSLIVSGAGDVIEPSDSVVGIGSGGPYAASAAKALLAHSTLDAGQIVEAALRIAGEVCIYTNTNIKVETI